MSKSKFLNNKSVYKTDFALLCILVMMGGFLCSRAANSMAIIAFGAVGIIGVNPKEWLKNKWWLLGATWIAFFLLSYFCSTDKNYWWDHCQVKMPLLLLPLAFGFLPPFSLRQQRIFTIAVGVMLLAGACYSISFFLKDPVYYAQEYKYSHLLPTPAKNDHIRFSLSIALYITWCFYFWPQLTKTLKWVTALIVLLLTIYLHILAAKSGLIILYFMFFCWIGYIIIARKKIIGLFILGLFLLGGFLAIKYIPTLKSRADYTYFNYYLYKNKIHANETYGDIARVRSFKVARKIILAHPWLGVGVGDMFTETTNVYTTDYPATTKENVLLPHDQFLIVAIGCGIPVAVIFLIWAVFPLVWIRKNRQSFFFFIVWASLFLQLLTEPVLELQYGVFVYLFFLLWQKHTIPARVQEQ